jgi:hypothetical protein
MLVSYILLFEPEDGSSMLFRNVDCCHPPDDTVLYPQKKNAMTSGLTLQFLC